MTAAACARASPAWKKKLTRSSAERALRRQRRSSVPLPQIALIGYTNAGKSTLLNALANTNTVYADDKLFATLDPTTRRVPMRGGGQMLFTDTVGFIQKLPHALVSAFRATLEETAFADVLLHIHDASSPLRESQSRTVRQILTDLHIPRLPVIDVMNKTDLLPAPRLRALKEQYPQAVFISAQNKQGLPPLLAAVEKALQKKMEAIYAVFARGSNQTAGADLYALSGPATHCPAGRRTGTAPDEYGREPAGPGEKTYCWFAPVMSRTVSAPPKAVCSVTSERSASRGEILAKLALRPGS